MMLLLTLSQPAALFCFKLPQMLPQIRQSLIPQTLFFHYEMSKSLEMLFQCWVFLPILVQ